MILGLYPEEGSDWAVNAPGGKITVFVLLLRILGKNQEATEAGLSSACLHRTQTKLPSSINYGREADGSPCDDSWEKSSRISEELSRKDETNSQECPAVLLANAAPRWVTSCCCSVNKDTESPCSSVLNLSAFLHAATAQLTLHSEDM